MSSKAATDRVQRQLLELPKLPGNDQCADCKAKHPRWASWDHGVFLCVQCSGLHRKMGTHISRVKSLTLDTWSKDQVEHMRVRGNTKVNAELNPDEARNPPPSSFDANERESALERYIRAKYEYRSFSQPARRSPAPSPAPEPSAPRAPTPNPTASIDSAQPTANEFLLSSMSASTSSPSMRPRASTAPPPMRASTPPPPLPSRPNGSKTPSPENAAKHVRFRSDSMPIFDEDDRPLRTPSPARERKPPAKGILRPRSALSNSVSSMDAPSWHPSQNNGWPSGASSTSALSNVNGFGPSARLGVQTNLVANDHDDEVEMPTNGFPVAQRLIPMHTGSAIAYNSTRSIPPGQVNGIFTPNLSMGSSTSHQPAVTTTQAPNPFGQSQPAQNQFGQMQPMQQPTGSPSAQPSSFLQSLHPQQQQQSFSPFQPQPQPSPNSIWDKLDLLASIGAKPTMNGFQLQPSTMFAPPQSQPPPPQQQQRQQQQQQQPQALPTSNPFSFAPKPVPNAFAPAPSPSFASTPAPLRPQVTGFVPSSDFGKQLAGESELRSYQPSFLSTPMSSFGAPSSAPPAVAPLRPQVTGFVPSSRFGQELAQENLRPSSANGFSSISTLGTSPLRPNMTGYPSAPTGSPGRSFSSQPPSQNSMSYQSALSPSTTPFLHSTMTTPAPPPPPHPPTSNGFSMQNLHQALPPTSSAQGHNPFFSNYQQAPQMGLQPQRTGMNPFFATPNAFQQQQRTPYASTAGQWRS